jgi:hypothetical protein
MAPRSTGAVMKLRAWLAWPNSNPIPRLATPSNSISTANRHMLVFLCLMVQDYLELEANSGSSSKTYAVVFVTPSNPSLGAL